jgi:hypothetical protein
VHNTEKVGKCKQEMRCSILLNIQVLPANQQMAGRFITQSMILLPVNISEKHAVYYDSVKLA